MLATRNVRFAATLKSAADLEAALTSLRAASLGDLVALEVVWTPDSKSDAMARDDMESRFPALREF